MGPVNESSSDQPRILERTEHSLSRQNMSRNAVKVLYRLSRSGFKGYLVGGSVRDLLLGRTPKDYDAGTDASPPQIRRLFRNSRIIGRRFRLAHVFFHDGVIEVATFRRQPKPEEQASAPDDLLITSDNTFGSPQEDAFRRDFTINALFYNIADFTVIDYVGGIRDLERQLIRCIGEPAVRFQEDPVRMMRACEFAARLGFGIEDATQEAMLAHRQELQKASPARLTEELIQLLSCGHAGAAIQWMLDLGLVEVLLPEVQSMLSGTRPEFGELSRILPVIDSLVRDKRCPGDGTLLAAMLLPDVLVRRAEREERSGKPMSRAAIDKLVERATAPFIQRFALSNARAQSVLGALSGFQRLCEPRWNDDSRRRFASRKHFSEALALFEIMVEATGGGHEALETWRQVDRLPRDSRATPPPRRRRRQRRSRRGTKSRQESV